VAERHLTVLRDPEFPQAFKVAIDRVVDHVLRVVHSRLSPCSYEEPESRRGACDSIPCCSFATVHSLVDDRDYCLTHFRKVSRG
jgi:hypothetical protein